MKNKSLLKEILIEGICHFDNIKRTQEEEKLLSELITHDNEMRNKLALVSSELSGLYDKTNKIIEYYNCSQVNTAYVEGFKLGFSMCLEFN